MTRKEELLREWGEIYRRCIRLQVVGRAFEPRARHGEVVMADPQGQAKLGQEVLAIRADGSVQLGDLVASCGGGAFNLRTPRGDYFCLRPGDATLAPVLAISLGVPDGMRRPAPGGSA